MHYKLLYQNINDLFCGQTLVAWKNLKAQDDSLRLNDDLIGILSYKLPKHGNYGKFYSSSFIHYFSFVLELRKSIQDKIKSTPKQELALPVPPWPFLFQ